MKHFVFTEFECGSRQSAYELEQQVAGALCWKMGSATHETLKWHTWPQSRNPNP